MLPVASRHTELLEAFQRLLGGHPDALLQWVKRYLGPPQALSRSRVASLVRDVDVVLRQPSLGGGNHDADFRRQLLRLRDLFAARAGMATVATIQIGVDPPTVTEDWFAAPLAECLERFLTAPIEELASWQQLGL
jgi:hypothetical protein